MKPLKMDKLMDNFLKDPWVSRLLLRGRLFSAYKNVVKDVFPEETKPIDYKRGKLIIQVSSSAMLNEIHFFKELLIERINQELGDALLKDIVFKIKEDG